MQIFSLGELFDLIIMVVSVGFIFMNIQRSHSLKFNIHNFLFAVLIAAPAVVFHELAHKLSAVALGVQATFHASYAFLGIGIILKLLNFPLVFFVPGYVQFSCSAVSCILPRSNIAIIALAGPFLNFVLFLASFLLYRFGSFSNRANAFLRITQRINLFLFILNMLPIPFLDGGTALKAIMGW